MLAYFNPKNIFLQSNTQLKVEWMADDIQGMKALYISLFLTSVIFSQ